MNCAIRGLLAMVVVLSLGTVQEGLAAGQADSGEPAQGEPAQTEAEAVQIITGLDQEGELRAVDTDERFFLVVGRSGNEMLFHYDDQTAVVGETEGVQGLTGQAGTWVQIEFRAEGERAIAERIELGEGEAGTGEAPAPAQPEAGPDR